MSAAVSPSSKPRSRKKVAASTDETHQTRESIAQITLTPPHPPREDTPEYQAAHDFLVHQKKAGCHVCGVNMDTLSDAKINRFGAKALETHHSPIERSMALACDPLKVHADYPQVYDVKTLLAFVDSPANLLVLCDVHHRSEEYGIHHMAPAAFQVQKYLYDGYQIAATPADAAQAQARDDVIMERSGIEQAVQDGSLAEVEAAATAKPKTAKPKTAKPKTAKPKTAKPKTAKPRSRKPRTPGRAAAQKTLATPPA